MVAKQAYEEFRGSPEEVEQLLKDMSRMKVTDPEYTAKYFKVMLSDTSGTARNFVPKPQMADTEKKKQEGGPGPRDLPPHLEPPRDNRFPARTSYQPRNYSEFEDRTQGACFGCGQIGHNSQNCPAMRHLMMDNLTLWDWGQQKWTLPGGRMIQWIGNENLSEAVRRLAGTGEGPVNRVNYLIDSTPSYFVKPRPQAVRRRRYATHPDELDYPSLEQREGEYKWQMRYQQPEEDYTPNSWKPAEGKSVTLLTHQNPEAATAFKRIGPSRSTQQRDRSPPRYSEDSDREQERIKHLQEDDSDPMYESGFGDDSDSSGKDSDTEDEEGCRWESNYEDDEDQPLLGRQSRNKRAYFSEGSALAYPALRDQPQVTRKARSKAAGGGYQFAQNRRAQEFQEGLSIAERQRQCQLESAGRNQARAERMAAREECQDREEDAEEEQRLASNPMRQKTPPPQDFSSKKTAEKVAVNEDVPMGNVDASIERPTQNEKSRAEPPRPQTPVVRQQGQAQANALRPTPFDAWNKRRPSNFGRNGVSFERGRPPNQGQPPSSLAAPARPSDSRTSQPPRRTEGSQEEGGVPVLSASSIDQ